MSYTKEPNCMLNNASTTSCFEIISPCVEDFQSCWTGESTHPRAGIGILQPAICTRFIRVMLRAKARRLSGSPRVLFITVT